MDKHEYNTFFKLTTKYIIEGIAVAIVAFYIPIFYKTSLRKPTFNEIFALAVTTSLSMIILDYFSEQTGLAARFGTGFTIGKQLVGF